MQCSRRIFISADRESNILQQRPILPPTPIDGLKTGVTDCSLQTSTESRITFCLPNLLRLNVQNNDKILSRARMDDRSESAQQ